MSIHHDQFDFAAFLRAEARDAAADERTHGGDNTPLAPIVSKQWLEPDSGALSGEAGNGTDDRNGNAGRRPDGIGIDRRTLKFGRRSALLSRSVKSPLTVVSPLRRNFVGAAALVSVAVAIVVVLAHHLVLRPSNPRTDLSGTSKLASTNPRLVEAPRLPPARSEAPPIVAPEGAPIAGSLNAIQPESVRDTVDPDIKLRSSSEAKTSESMPPVAFASVKTPASSGNTPSSDLPKLASTYSPPVVARPLSVPLTDEIPPTTQQSVPPSRSARRTTASLSQSTPSLERKTTGLNPDTMQPHIGDVALRKHDQKPSKAPETRSCTAVIFSGYVEASAHVKTGQLDVRKICADQHASFTVSLRCLVASVICPNLSH